MSGVHGGGKSLSLDGNAGVVLLLGGGHTRYRRHPQASPRRVSRLHQCGVSKGPKTFKTLLFLPPFLVWRLAPSPARWSPLAISLLGALALPKSHPPQAFDPRQLEPPTSNSRNTSQCNNTSPSRCWGGKVSRDARALTPSSSRSSAPSPPIVSRPSGLGSGAAHRRARPLSSSSSASSPGSSSSSSASSPRNGPHPWPLSESLGTGPVPSA